MTSEQQNDRYERGYAALSEVANGAQDAVIDGLADIAPHMGRYIVEFGFGDIYTRPGLTRRQRQLGTVAALAALGNAAPQLRFHIGGALNVGCTREEVVEVLIHVAVYAGFPAALNGLTAAREVFESRPDEPALVPADTSADQGGDRFERGRQALADIDGHAGQQVIDSLKDVAPDLARYLLEFAFGDVYSRTGLDLPTRELVTVALCTALGTVGPQLRVHLHGLLNVGGTREEAVEIITQMAGYAGFPAALNGLTAAREVFAARDGA